MPDLIDPLEIATYTPAAFAEYCSDGQWTEFRHNTIIDEALCEAVAGNPDYNRIVLTVPPQHGKSTHVSHYFPAWYLGKFPDNRVILSSYEADFAAQWGGLARDVLTEFGPELFDVQVDQRSKKRSRWDILGHRGGMFTAGVGGPTTGKGANLFIIDDPIKNEEWAMSAIRREKQVNWFKSVAYTRLRKGAIIIIILTRWHAGDLAGHVLKNFPDDWLEIRIPELAEANDLLDRKIGENLCPELFTQEESEKKKEVLGPYWHSAMCQGRPAPEGGGVYHWESFLYYERTGEREITVHGEKESEEHRILETIQVVDPAFGKKDRERNSFCVIGLWALIERKGRKDLALIDLFRKRCGWVALRTKIKAWQNEWNSIAAYVESWGVMEGYLDECAEHGIRTRQVSPESADKETRATFGSGIVDGGRCFIPTRAHWLPDFEEEVKTFPNAEQDDQVDMLSYAMILLSRMKPLKDQITAVRREGHEQEDWRKRVDGDWKKS